LACSGAEKAEFQAMAKNKKKSTFSFSYIKPSFYTSASIHFSILSPLLFFSLLITSA
jgi:hypothetical protein